jgi:hypothetical protein
MSARMIAELLSGKSGGQAMGNRIEIKAGDRYGRLTVIQEVDSVMSGRAIRCVLCQCDCGNTLTVWLQSVRSGNTTSCGCALNGGVNHGHSKAKTRTYQAWASMKRRCLNPNVRDYNNYGGRGISICQRWMDSFEAFLNDMGEIPDGMSIDRIDNDANYEPANCRWATRKQQARNTRSNRIVTYNGESKCLVEWSEKTRIPYQILWGRLSKGWSVEDALTITTNGRRASQ